VIKNLALNLGMLFRIESNYYEKFKWKVFYNTRKGANSKQCQPFNENDIVHMFGKFTFIKADGVETLAVNYLISNSQIKNFSLY